MTKAPPRRQLSERQRLMAVVAVYVVLALLYLIQMPIGRQPDETSHVQYIAHLATRHRFPVFHGRNDGIYEAHQPPLYYLICVPGYLTLHGVSEDAPAYAARLVSLIAGLAIVLLTVAMARRLFPYHTLPRVIAPAIVALLPMHLNVSASVGNDALGGVFCTAVLALLLGAFPRWQGWRRSVLLGVLTGLGLLSKSSCVLLLPLILVALLIPERDRPVTIKQTIAQFAIVLSCCLLVSGFWLLRNLRLYGDPFAFKAFNEGFSSSPHPSFFLDKGMSLFAYLLMVVQLTFMTFWGMFGEVNESIKRLALMYATGEGVGVYLLLAIVFVGVTIMSAVGLIFFVKSLSRRSSPLPLPTRRGFFVLVVGCLLVLAQYVQFNTVYFQAQARYLHPMLAAIACLMALGMDSVPAHRWKWVWVYAIIFGMLVSSLLNLTVWLTPVA